MASVKITGLPQKRATTNNFTYCDLHLDIQTGSTKRNEMFQKPETNDFKADYDIEAIRNSLVNLFSTTPGQKILNPEYGLDLRKFLFLPATVDTAEEIRREIYTQFTRSEPRVTIKSVKITVFEDVNEYDITIYYNIPALNIENITMLGTLNQNGYTQI